MVTTPAAAARRPRPRSRPRPRPGRSRRHPCAPSSPRSRVAPLLRDALVPGGDVLASHLGSFRAGSPTTGSDRAKRRHRSPASRPPSRRRARPQGLLTLARGSWRRRPRTSRAPALPRSGRAAAATVPAAVTFPIAAGSRRGASEDRGQPGLRLVGRDLLLLPRRVPAQHRGDQRGDLLGRADARRPGSSIATWVRRVSTSSRVQRALVGDRAAELHGQVARGAGRSGSPAPGRPRSGPARRAARRRSGAASAAASARAPRTRADSRGSWLRDHPPSRRPDQRAGSRSGWAAAPDPATSPRRRRRRGPWAGRSCTCRRRWSPSRPVPRSRRGRGTGPRWCSPSGAGGGEQRAQPGVGAEQVGAPDLAAQQLVDVAQQVVDVLLLGRRGCSCRRRRGCRWCPAASGRTTCAG